MTWTLRVRGASSQPIARDFLCDECGPFSATVDRDAEVHPCPDCNVPRAFVLSPPRVSIPIAEVVKGGVAKPDSPMYLDTRDLGNGMSATEWRAKRDKIYEERRHAEAKEFDRFCKGVS